MSYSTLLVLLLLTFGQVLILGMGFFVLWLAGEFEDGNGRNGSAFRLRPVHRLGLRARLSTRRFLRRLRSAAKIGGRPYYSRVIVTSFFVAAAAAAIVITMRASIERSKTASVPTGSTDGSNPIPR